MKILFFDNSVYDFYRDGYMDRIQEAGLDLSLVNPKELTMDEEAEVLVSGRVRSSNLDLLPNLKMIIVPYTGLNGLDLPAIESKGIKVLNTSAHSHFVAERALALILALRGNLVNFHNSMVKGNWSNRYEDDRLSWTSLFGKKVAIYGYGSIGQNVAALMKPFGVEIGIIAYKKRSFEGAENFESLEALCRWCDLLMITAPLNEHTEGSVNDSVLKEMDGKYIVNVGRGAVIEEEALYKRLSDGTLAGFASDVWFQYPNKQSPDRFPSAYPIHELSNVIMTPHNAGFEVTSRQVRYGDVLDQIIEFARSESSSDKVESQGEV